MATETTLLRIGGLHVLLVASLSAILSARAGSVLLGGAVIGGATLAYWAITRGLFHGVSRIWLAALAVLKVAAYLVIVGAGLAGALPVDPAGFAAGVTCFPLAVVAGSLASAARARVVVSPSRATPDLPRGGG